jgi:predicted nucleotidyltransferase
MMVYSLQYIVAAVMDGGREKMRCSNIEAPGPLSKLKPRRRKHRGEIKMDMESAWLDALRSWASTNDSIRELWLFGSRAKGTSHSESDVDIAVVLMPAVGKHNWALGNYFALQGNWKRQLEAIVGRHVSLEAIEPLSHGDAEVRAPVSSYGVAANCSDLSTPHLLEFLVEPEFNIGPNRRICPKLKVPRVV